MPAPHPLAACRERNHDVDAPRIEIDSRDEFDAGLLARPPEPLVDGGEGDAMPGRKRKVCGVIGGQLELTRDIHNLAKRGAQEDAFDLHGKR